MWCCLFVSGLFVFFFKQKTAYEMRISDWSSDVCSSDLAEYRLCHRHALYSALLWGALFWVQGPVPTLDHILSMWTIAVLMMVTLSIVAHSLPQIGRAHV